MRFLQSYVPYVRKDLIGICTVRVDLWCGRVRAPTPPRPRSSGYCIMQVVVGYSYGPWYGRSLKLATNIKGGG